MVDDPRARSSELAWQASGDGEHFRARRKRLGREAGGQQLGCSMVALDPGDTAWPAHAHLGNEEAIYVLEGRGRLRLGDRFIAIAAGDYIALLAGPEAHQITNTGDEELCYLAISTMREPDVILYPDSDKVGVLAGAAPGGDASARTVDGFWPLQAQVDYYSGERKPDSTS